MRIAMTEPLFAWDCMDDSPSLQTVRNFLHALPDAKLLEALHTWRGRGRDDYPVTTLWGVCVLMPLLRHVSIEATLAELRRNEGLRRLIGIESEQKVPKKWNVSRDRRPAHPFTLHNATGSRPVPVERPLPRRIDSVNSLEGDTGLRRFLNRAGGGE